MKVFLDNKQCAAWTEVCNASFFQNSVGKFFFNIAYGEYELTSNADDCDIYVTECSRLNILEDKINVIFCGESDDGYLQYYKSMEQSKFKKNIKFIGTVEDSEVSFNIPVQHRRSIDNDFYTLNSINENDCPFENRLRKICFMRRPESAQIDFKQFREKLASELNVVYVNGEDKISIISKYLFNFCAENSLSYFNGNEGYITEKIYDAVGAYCIPVYYGGNLNKYTILNTERILQINNGNNMIDDYHDIVSSLDENYLEYLYHLPLLRADYQDFIQDRKKLFKEFMNNF